MCCTRLAGNTGRKNDAKKSPSADHRTTFSDYIFAIKACIDNRKKKLVKQQYLPHMSLQYGELRPTSGWDFSLVWGTSANFNGFRVFTELLHGTLLVGVSQTAALNRGRNLYSAGRPSRWALAHISSLILNCPQKFQKWNSVTYEWHSFMFRMQKHNATWDSHSL